MLNLILRGLAPDTVVMAAGDGVEALTQVQALRPQAAVVNLLLPRLSGLDTIRQLRARLGTGFPIVAVSALGLREVVQQAVTAGACDFIIRPCDPARIVEKVRAALAWAEASAQVAGASSPAAARQATFPPRPDLARL